jgi:pyridoxal phosphate enzyme (YggS family)
MTDTDSLEASIRERYAQVRRRIEGAATVARRDPGEITVVAVTKGFGVDVVRAAAAVGIDNFGENRVQEAEPKIEAVPSVKWHLIGHLQSNKARRALTAFDVIQSVDSIDLLDRLESVAEGLDVDREALLQVNLAGVARQHGFDAAWFEEASSDGRLAVALGPGARRVRVVGLMGIGPFTTDQRASRASFVRLRELRDRLQDAVGFPLPELSMGMSADYALAIEEGATMVRLGTALFGERPTPD